MNTCNFTGRLTKDPELKTTQSGKKYTMFCLAVDGIKDKDGNKTADFVDFVAWNKSAEIIAQYARKGSKLGVSGRLHTTIKEDNGEKHKYTEIIVNEFDLLDSKPKDQADNSNPQVDNVNPQVDNVNAPIDTPSELPFEL